MQKIKIAANQWAVAQANWEGESGSTFSQIAQSLGISRQSVHKHAKKNGWTKRSDMQKIVDKAHQLADRFTTEGAMQHPMIDAVGDFQGPKKGNVSAIAEKDSAEPTKAMRQQAEENAINARARIIERHRREWDGARNLIYQAIKTADFEKAKLAKITAEAIKIVQDGERKAWHLDKDEASVGPTTIIIERRQGKLGSNSAAWNCDET
jgi:predicted transcriptional regulator